MTDLEGNLDALADAIAKDAQGKALRREAAFEGGVALLELKAALSHGDFLPMLERLGCSPRKAQRWMEKAGKAEALNTALDSIKAGIAKYREGAQLTHKAIADDWGEYDKAFDSFVQGQDVGLTLPELQAEKAQIQEAEKLFLADCGEEWEWLGLPGKPVARGHKERAKADETLLYGNPLENQG